MSGLIHTMTSIIEAALARITKVPPVVRVS